MTKTPIAVLGIELGKNSCSLAGMDAAGAVVMRKRMTRDAIVTFATTFGVCHRHGGVLRRALPGADLGAVWAHDPPYVAGICPALRQGAEDR